MNKIYKISIISITLFIISIVIVSIYQINQKINDTTPFDYKVKLPKNKSEYIINVDIGCNRFDHREIGVIFKPNYIRPNEYTFKSILVSDYEIKQDGRTIKKGLSTNITTYGDIKRVVLLKYEPLGSFFCSKQNIKLKIKKVNQDINFSNNELLFYISKPRSL